MKILVIRRDNIGDLVCTTPLIASLRHNLPGATIFALVNTYNAAVLRGNPDADCVIAYTKGKHQPRPWQRLVGMLNWARMILTLRREGFDVAILAHSGFDRQGLLLAKLAGARRTIGFSGENNGSIKGLTDALPSARNMERHEVELLADLLKPLGIKDMPGPLRLFPDSASATAYRRDFLGGADQSTKLVAVHISAREANRRWPAERFVALLRYLARQPGHLPVLFWAPGQAGERRHPGDDDQAKAILAATRDIRVIPSPTSRLEELIDALAACDFFVGSDGGALHIAAGVGLPSVALFENRRGKYLHWYPWQTTHEMVISPAREIQAITVDEVIAAWEELKQKETPGISSPERGESDPNSRETPSLLHPGPF